MHLGLGAFTQTEGEPALARSSPSLGLGPVPPRGSVQSLPVPGGRSLPAPPAQMAPCSAVLVVPAARGDISVGGTTCPDGVVVTIETAPASTALRASVGEGGSFLMSRAGEDIKLKLLRMIQGLQHLWEHVFFCWIEFPCKEQSCIE